MAKVGKELGNKREVSLWFRHQVLIRKTGFKKLIDEDENLREKMEEIAQRDKNYNKNPLYNRLSKKRDELESNLLKKYNILCPYEPYPDEPNFVMPILGDGIVELIHDEKEATKKWFKKRYLSFRIDTFQDLDLIKVALSDYLKVINNTFRKAYGIKIPKSIHLRNAYRYFKAFDFRNKKPPLSFLYIASTLINEGYYKNKTLEQVIQLAKNDFRTIFKKIYDIPYKEYDKKEFKKSDFKECRDCAARSNCKEPCADLEYQLAEVEVKQKHYIGTKDVSEWNK